MHSNIMSFFVDQIQFIFYYSTISTEGHKLFIVISYMQIIKSTLTERTSWIGSDTNFLHSGINQLKSRLCDLVRVGCTSPSNSLTLPVVSEVVFEIAIDDSSSITLLVLITSASPPSTTVAPSQNRHTPRMSPILLIYCLAKDDLFSHAAMLS